MGTWRVPFGAAPALGRWVPGGSQLGFRAVLGKHQSVVTAGDVGARQEQVNCNLNRLFTEHAAAGEHLNASAFMLQSDSGSPLFYALKEVILIYYFFGKWIL